jgi:rare lipoprotein A
MPLPSYARVTNLSNGSSIVVRVNDRGPYERNRVIDLSSRTAELLDVKGNGTAKVKVEYVGPARMDGNDASMLIATYVGPGSSAGGATMVAMRQLKNGGDAGRSAPAPQPVMVAMRAPQPAAAPQPVAVAMRAPSADPAVMLALAPIPRARPDVQIAGTAIDPYDFEVLAAENTAPAVPVATPVVAEASAAGTTYGERTLGTYTVSEPVAYTSSVRAPVLPASASPEDFTLQPLPATYGRSSYAADAFRTPAQRAAEAMAGGGGKRLTKGVEARSGLQSALDRVAASRKAALTEIQVGVFSDAANAARVAERIGHLGSVRFTNVAIGGRSMQSVRLVVVDGSLSGQDAMDQVAAAGAPGAYIITR